MTGNLIGRLRHAVGSSGVISDPDEMAGYLTDWRNAYAGTAAAVVRPGNTEEVAAVVIVLYLQIAVVQQALRDDQVVRFVTAREKLLERRTSADRTAALAPWLAHYNTQRRHSALGGLPPISRLSPT